LNESSLLKLLKMILKISQQKINKCQIRIIQWYPTILETVITSLLESQKQSIEHCKHNKKVKTMTETRKLTRSIKKQSIRKSNRYKGISILLNRNVIQKYP